MPYTHASFVSPIIFLHNLKTGGVTLRHIISRQYGPRAVHTTRGTPAHLEAISELDELRSLDSRGVDVVQGHMPFGLHAVLRRPAAYVSLVRDPLERIVSLYYHVLRKPSHKWHRHVREISIDEFALRCELAEVDNGQTRRLAGDAPPPGACTRATLDRALQNIERHFAVVGTTERFDESLLLMKRAFGWPTPFYLRANVGRQRPSIDALDQRTITIIESRNELDQELYSHVSVRLEDQVDRLGEEFRLELETLRTVNRELELRNRRPKRSRTAARGESRCSDAHDDPRESAIRLLIDAHVALIRREEALTSELAAARRAAVTEGSGATELMSGRVGEFLLRLARHARSRRPRWRLSAAQS